MVLVVMESRKFRQIEVGGPSIINYLKLQNLVVLTVIL